MKMRSSLLASLVLLTASAAQAGGVLATAPANASAPEEQTLTCTFANVGTKPMIASGEVIGADGTTLASTSSELAPGETNGVSAGAGNGVWCRFTAVSGSTKSLRGAAVYDNGSEYTMAIPAQ
jgi:hypothetical protein